MKETTIKAAFSAAFAALSAYLGIMAVPMIMLIIALIADYISGVTKAVYTKTLSSRTGFRGAVKKVAYLFVVAAAMGTDWLVHEIASYFGSNFYDGYYIGLIVIIWLFINELVSILENCAAMGVPVLPFLNKIINRLKSVIDKEGKDE